MTQGRLSAGLALGLTFAAASGAAAASVIMTPALGAFGTNHLVCSATNAGSKDVDVTIQILNQSGGNLVSLGFTIPPGEAKGVGSGAGPGQGYCRVTGAPKTKVRVALCASDSLLTCLAAVPGQ